MEDCRIRGVVRESVNEELFSLHAWLMQLYHTVASSWEA